MHGQTENLSGDADIEKCQYQGIYRPWRYISRPPNKVPHFWSDLCCYHYSCGVWTSLTHTELEQLLKLYS